MKKYLHYSYKLLYFVKNNILDLVRNKLVFEKKNQSA